MDSDRELDVAVFGATGFAGRLVAAYLAGHAPNGTRIGLAGRSAVRLEEVRAGLGDTAKGWPLLVADSADPASLAVLARSARVVATTVGSDPYFVTVSTPSRPGHWQRRTRWRSSSKLARP